MKKQDFTVKRMVLVSILAALSLVLYIIGPKFSLPIFPSFLVINFSMLPIFICLFMLGPIDALIVLLLRFLIKLPFTSTACIGEVTDVILGLIVVVGTYIATLIFKGKHKNIGIFGFAFIFWIIGGCLANTFALPGYINICNIPVEGIVNMMPEWTNATMDNYIWKYFLFAVVPFNAFISIIVIAITWPIHNRLKTVYENFDIKKKKNNDVE